jgi:GntR family transcriptional regulator / MocR family aminotransferase
LVRSDRATFAGRDLHLDLEPAAAGSLDLGPLDLGPLDLNGPAGRRSALEEALRRAIRTGRLAAGVRLPSTRALAADLGVARGTVTDAYDQLAAEGWLVARQGSGTRVASAPTGPTQTAADRPAVTPDARPALRHDFRPGHGDLSSFPRRQWVAALRRALREAPDAALDYGDPRGLPVLREAVAAYIGRARGLPVDPEFLVVCSGWVQGFALIAEVLRDGGATRVAVEDPSMARNPAVLRRFGLEPVSVDIDGHGADPSTITGTGPVAAAVLTPAHQYPTGATLSAGRRAAWLDWARAHDGVLIEDDYDAEFRYDRQPVGALAALDPERVIYAGTTSKTLAPGLRLGWLVLPRRWLEAVAALRPVVDRHTNALDQLALAEMITSGAFDRHVRYSRMHYRRRRDLLLGLLEDQVPAVAAHGIAAGLHTVIDLPVDGPAEAEVVARLAEREVAVHALGGYRHRTAVAAPPALVVGFATPPAHSFALDVRALVDALADIYR